SATMLQQVYSPIHGDWTLQWEHEYQQLHALELTLVAYQNDPVRRAELLGDAPADNCDAAWERSDSPRLPPQGHGHRVRSAAARLSASIRRISARTSESI